MVVQGEDKERYPLPTPPTPRTLPLPSADATLPLAGGKGANLAFLALEG